MNGSSFTAERLKGLMKPACVCFLILTFCTNLFAQYKGAPVKKDRLLKALRSKQLQTRDIVSVISSNGVDFVLTDETRQALVAAGARPEVIRAIADNPRLENNETFQAKKRKAENPVKAPSYQDLIDQAMLSFKDRKNPQIAAQFLQTAVKINPSKPEAYQLLGFVNLYGLNDVASAEKLMREAFNNGGSAVFRVYHDDSGSFNSRCSGSLYISSDSIRFESDDNRHTFETSTVNVEKFKLDSESNREWKNRAIFKILLKIGKSDIKFRFAPISGKETEAAMVERFVYVSKNNFNFAGATAFRNR